MKKSIKLKFFFIAVSVVSAIVISSCEKNSNTYKNLLGTWISTDLIDTVEFRTESDFYKTVGVPKDHFYYSVSADSMTIQYKGALYVYVHPTNHYYKLNGDLLTIDLNNCYGFRSQVIAFSKK
jgi:hypothetical protein